MANRNESEQKELRRLVAAALAVGITDPRDVYAYILDNGWLFGSISMATIHAVMRENGLEYVTGRWEKK
jgi:hypothetical protein